METQPKPVEPPNEQILRVIELLEERFRCHDACTHCELFSPHRNECNALLLRTILYDWKTKKHAHYTEA